MSLTKAGKKRHFCLCKRARRYFERMLMLQVSLYRDRSVLNKTIRKTVQLALYINGISAYISD